MNSMHLPVNQNIAALIRRFSYEIYCPVKMWIDLRTWNIVNQDFHMLNATINSTRYSTKTQQMCDPGHFKKRFVFGSFYVSEPNPILNFVHNIYDHRVGLDH